MPTTSGSRLRTVHIPILQLPNSHTRWPEGAIFFREIQRDLLLWLCSFFFLGVFRLGMVWMFRSPTQAWDWSGDVLQVLSRGARFDSMVAAYPVLLSFPLTLSCLVKDLSRIAQRIRVASAMVAIPMHLAICGITVCYFKEYHDQFNQWIVGLITDDLVAIMLTIWRGYPVLLYLMGYAGIVAAWVWIVPRLFRWFPPWKSLQFSMPSLLTRLVLALLVGGLLFLAIRGWSFRRPMKQRDLKATRDLFLNKLVANPYVALRYAILDYKYITGAKGLETFIGRRSVLDAAQVVLGNIGAERNLDVLCQRKTAGRPGPKPQHIFLIIGESLDVWPLLPVYQPLGLADGLVQLATNGVFVKSFLPAGFETIHATCTIVTGLPEAGVNVNYQPSSQKPFPTAAAPIFKRLGYRTRFIYGGYSWQRVDEFCIAQGFDDYIGAAATKGLPVGAIGTWGAFDEFLFDVCLREITPDVPSFNVILTTANHPPYDCDVFARGFPHKTMPPPYDRLYDKTNPMKVFGHQWYTAKCISEFVKASEARYPGSIFVITGDHASRHFLNSHPTLYERTSVPCIFYGPGVLGKLKSPASMAGSHLDLVPTLVELCAEPGFEYAAFGQNLLAERLSPVGFGAKAVVTPECIFTVSDDHPIEPVPGHELPSPLPSRAALDNYYRCLHALAWWRVMKGSALPPP